MKTTSPVCLLLLLSAAARPVGAAGQDCDFFCYIIEANKASLVVLEKNALLPPPLAARIASGIRQVEEEQQATGAARARNYLRFEERLIEATGPEASQLHMGRSRQDLHETVRRMQMRAAFFRSFRSQLEARKALLELSGRHVDTIVPAYTHGVQAQPVSLAHYLLAFSYALERDADRLQESFARLNRSPLGAAALGTSGFEIDRERLAELLGFSGPVENSYDANLVSSADAKIEFAGILANSAIHVGQFAQDLHTQYHDPRPWIMIDAGTTDVSSIMPQKRNPRPIDRLRSLASSVVAGAQAVTLAAHNTNTGMNDYRNADPLFELAGDAEAMYQAWAKLLAGLRVSRERALEEVESDYSTMTEVADVLLRSADVPFRIAHHYASELTEYGRAQGKRPAALSDAEIMEVYRRAVGSDLPVPVGLIRDAMDPVSMVRNRKGLGGPQPAEVMRMLDVQARELEADTAWLRQAETSIATASALLEARFDDLAAR